MDTKGRRATTVPLAPWWAVVIHRVLGGCPGQIRQRYTHVVRKQCDKHDSDLFETGLLLEPTICITGPEAAEFFYDTVQFRRHGDETIRVQKTLYGEGGVQSMDGMPTAPQADADSVDHARTGSRAGPTVPDLWQATTLRWAETDRGPSTTRPASC